MTGSWTIRWVRGATCAVVLLGCGRDGAAEGVFGPDEAAVQLPQEEGEQGQSEEPRPVRPGRVLGIGGGAGGRAGRGKIGSTVPNEDPVSGRSVEMSLSWLARHQDPGGFWSSASFGDRCEGDRCSGPGNEPLDVSVTGLSLLAFMSAGNMVNRGDHKMTMRKGIKYLLSIQDEETGCFGEVNSHKLFLYDHAIATLAMVEMYGLTKWPTAKEPAQKGVNFILASRNPTKAWRYTHPPNGSNDMSVSGWMAIALCSARDFGLKVDDAAFEGVRSFIDEMTDEVSGRTGYAVRGGPSDRSPEARDRWPGSKTEAITAVAMLCRMSMGEDPRQSEPIRRGAELLRATPPVWSEEEGTIDLHYWTFGSYAMQQLGGEDWDAWRSKIADAVMKSQSTDGEDQGSWDPKFDPWGGQGGRVYATAMMTMCLEAYGR